MSGKGHVHVPVALELPAAVDVYDTTLRDGSQQEGLSLTVDDKLRVAEQLDHLGVAYKGINVLDSDEIRNGIKTYSNWPTIPQLYVKGEFVGGADIVREMFQSGELKALLTDKGVLAA